MKIRGLQKLTLLDYPGKVACTVFTGGCNFRCPFCHNASLVLFEDDESDSAEVLELLKKRRGILEGVCITGGEPLLQPDVEDFMREIKDLGVAVKLDTNGSLPDKLRRIIEEGLADYVAMDIKGPQSKYALCSGAPLPFVEKVKESAALLMEGRVDYEFRTTVVRELHSDGDFHEIGRWIAGAKRYFLQGFVDSGDILAEGMSAASNEDMLRWLEITKQYVPNAEIRGVLL